MKNGMEFPSSYNYDSMRSRLGMWVFTVILWCILILLSHRPDRYIILVFPVLFTMASVFYTMTSSPVRVDSEGIGWTFFGWTWQFIKWEHVTRIREVEVIDPTDKSVEMAYNLHSCKKRQFFAPPIADTISQFESLKEIINENIKPGTVIEYKSKGKKLQRDRI